MPETVSNPTPYFQRWFDDALRLAEWNDASGGESAWFRVNPTLDTICVEEIRGGPNKAYSPAREGARPAWIDMTESLLQVSYEGTSTTITDQSASWTDEKTVASGDRAAGPEWLKLADGSWVAAHLGNACIEFSWAAPTMSDLAHVVREYLDRMSPTKKEWFAGDSKRLGAAATQQSLALAKRDGDTRYATAAPFLDVLQSALPDNPYYSAVREMSALAVKAAVLDEASVHAYIEGSYRRVPGPLALSAAREFDAHGLLDSAWWVSCCTTKKGAVAQPNLLRLAHATITRGLDESVSPQDAQDTMLIYLQDLLETYAENANYDKRAVTSVLRTITGPRSILTGRLIDIANSINAAGSKASLRGAEIKQGGVHSVGDALLTVLGRTWRYAGVKGTKEEQRAAWRERCRQHILHAEIIDALSAKMSSKPAAMAWTNIAEQSARLRYPNAKGEQLRLIRDFLAAGRSPADVREQLITQRPLQS